METENPKPQTGGLKLMTVFIVVLALHVLVIGGISAYHLFARTSGDSAGTITQKDTPTENTDAAKSDVTPEPLQADAATATPEDQSVANASAAQPVAPAPDGAAGNVTPAPVVGSQVITPVTPAPTPAPAPMHETQTATGNAAEKTNVVEVTVKGGDSLFKIARKNHVTVDSIKQLNGLTSDTLKIGQKLKVATKSAPAAAPAPAPVTTATQTAVAAAKAAPASGAKMYTVSKGDTLTKIAKQFNTTPTAIMTANNLSDPRKLSIGAKLKIPTQQADAAPTQAPSNAASAKPKAAPVVSSDLVMAR